MALGHRREAAVQPHTFLTLALDGFDWSDARCSWLISCTQQLADQLQAAVGWSAAHAVGWSAARCGWLISCTLCLPDQLHAAVARSAARCSWPISCMLQLADQLHAAVGWSAARCTWLTCGHHLTWDWAGHRAGLDILGKRKPCPCQQLNSISSRPQPTHNSNYTIMAPVHYNIKPSKD